MRKLLIITLWLIPLFSFCQTDHYFILFSARFPALRPFSIGGHAFVTWRREDSLFEEVHQHTYGFFPKKGMGLLNYVKGKVVEGYTQNSDRQRLIRRFIIEVDSLTYYKTIALSKEWNEKEFNLFNQNCVSFIDDVADKIGLLKPSKKSCIFPKKPHKYIKQLKKINKLRIVKNLYLEKVRLRILSRAQVVEFEENDED